MTSRACTLALFIALAAGATPAAAQGSVAVDRLLDLAVAYEAIDRGTAAALRQACAADALCVARRIVAHGGGRARLAPVTHPDTDSIRWVESEPSVTSVRRLADGRLLVRLDRFGRTAMRELRGALAGHPQSAPLLLDLRGNGGGDLGRMLLIAGLFIGAVAEPLFRVEASGRTAVAVVAPPDARWRGPVAALVGPGTASSAEILAALLRRHVGAAVLGQATAGKDYLYRVLPVDHDWRLLLPAERVEVPGETLAGGLQPDGPLPAQLAAARAQ